MKRDGMFKDAVETEEGEEAVERIKKQTRAERTRATHHRAAKLAN
jgi:hypothetical protein